MKNIRPLITLCFGFFLYFLLQAQPYQNEWINYEQGYYKVKIAKTGLYRISYTALQNTGLPLTGSGFQVFCKGQQIPIWVSTETDFTNPSDFIAFYATANDGSFDTQLFSNPNQQAQTQRSLFTDTLTYFITWNNNQPNQRYTLQPNNLSSPPLPDTYFMYSVKKVFWNQFAGGKPRRMGGVNVYLPFFEEGEGFVSSVFPAGSTYPLTLPTPNSYQNADAPFSLFKATLFGRSNSFENFPDHPFTIALNGHTYISDNFEGYTLKQVQSELLPDDIGTDNTLIQLKVGELSDLYNQLTISSVELSYPHTYNFGNSNYFEFSLPNNEDRYLEISNFNGGENALLFDLDNQWLFSATLENNVYRIRLPQGNIDTLTNRRLLLVNTDNYCPYPCIAPNCTLANCNTFQIETLIPQTFTNYALAANQGNYLIITHPYLQQGSTNWVQEYANYRSSAAGGSYTVQIVNIEELYDQFAWGIAKHPLSIRNLVNYAIDHWSSPPEYVLLLGKGISYESVRNNPLAYPKCLVPTFGHQPSDILLVSRSATNWLPQIPIGRVSAKNPDDVRRYFQKIIHHETPQPCTWEARAWTQKAINIASAHSPSERNTMLNILQKHTAILDSSVLNLSSIETYSQGSYTPPPQPEFNSSFNDGVLLLNYIGEAVNASGLNFDFGPVQNYQNTFRNPLILVNAASVGDAFSYGNTLTMSENYILADSIGAIAFIGSSVFENFTFSNPIYKLLLKKLFQQYPNKPLGYCLHTALADKYIPEANNQNEQMQTMAVLVLHAEGDPALQFLGRHQQPEFTFDNPNNIPQIAALNPQTGQIYTDSLPLINNDTLFLQLNISNIGANFVGYIPISLQLNYTSGNSGVFTDSLFINADTLSNTLQLAIPITLSNMPDTLQIVCTLNPNATIAEDCYDNNSSTAFTCLLPDICADLPLTPSITGLNPAYCNTDAPVLLQATPVGGQFWVNGVAQNFLHPDEGAGQYAVTYVYTDALSNCTYTTQTSVVINPNPIPQIEPATPLCQNSSTQLQLSQPYTLYQWSTGNIAPAITIANAGTYSVTVTDANNCSANTSVFIEQLPLPQLTMPDFIQTDSAALPYLLETGFNQPNAQYLWSNGETNSSIYITEAGQYNVTVTDANACTATAGVWIDISVGITAISLADIFLFPNPVNDVLIISGITQHDALLTVYNSCKQLVWQQNLQAQQTNSITLSALPSGIYWVQIVLPDKVTGQKIIKL